MTKYFAFFFFFLSFQLVQSVPATGATTDFAFQREATYQGTFNAVAQPSQPDTASNCDLVIKSYEQKGRALELDIFASEPGLIPFRVELIQGNRRWHWDSLHHQPHRQFRIEEVETTGEAAIKLISLGKPGCYATASLSLTDPSVTACDILVKNQRQVENKLVLTVDVPTSGSRPLDVTMTQGSKTWTWTQVVPQENQEYELPNIPTQGHIRLLITNPDKPGCKVEHTVTIRPHSNYGKVTTTGLSNKTGRMIVMNATGWGFDWQDKTGIAEPFRRQIAAFNSLYHNGENFQALDAFRLLVRWYEYEPREGQYRDEALLAALRWCKEHNMKFAVCFWPLRQQNDGLLPDTDWTRGMLGTVFSFEGNQYQPAIYSQAGREKLGRTLRHMAEVLAPYADDVVYLSLAYGDTEEYFSPGIIRQNPWAWTEVTGYSPANLAAWRTYSQTKGLGQVPPPVPDPGQMPWSTGQLWTSTLTGWHWYQFMTQGLREFWINFREAVKEGSAGKLKVAGYYADAAGAQSAWYMSYNLKSIFEGCDVIYTTEGGSQPDLMKKVMATDLNLGTFPRAQAAMEFDPNDLSFDNSLSPDAPLNPASLRDYGGSFFRRGGSIIHLAMSFSDGTTGRNQIRDLAPGLYYLRSEFIEQKPTPLPAPRLLSIPILRFEGDQYFEKWQQAGGSLTRQVLIRQEDVRKFSIPKKP